LSTHHRTLPSQGLLALLGLFLATGGALAAPAPTPPVTAAASSEIAVTVVEIPVEVTRQGQPVQGLGAADFEVVEAGRSLPVVGFETVDLKAPVRPGDPRPIPATRRSFLFLYDFSLSRPERLKGGVTAARELVASGLDPRDLVAVGIYLPSGELSLLLSFTADRAAATRTLTALEDLLNGKEAAASSDPGHPDPLRLTGLDARNVLTQTLRTQETNFSYEAQESLGPEDGSMGSYLQHDLLGHSGVLEQAVVEARQGDHVKALADAMWGLTELLRPVAGRKYLTLFSEGFSMSLAPHAVGSFRQPSVGNADVLLHLQLALGEMRHAGWVLHSVDVSGLHREEGEDKDNDGLFFLANETGGSLVEGTNRFAAGLGAVLQRSTYSYLLTVQTDAAPDGTYHPLEVRLRSDQRGARIHARDGYYAPVPFSLQSDVQRLADAAVLVAGGKETDDLGIQIAAVPLEARAETASVAVLVEIPGAALLASAAPRLGVEVFVYALDEAGNSSDFFAQAVALDRDRVANRLAQGGVRVLARLDLPAGPHRLRVLARDRQTGRSSLLTVPLDVKAPAGATALEALFLPAADDPWVLVRPESAAFDLHGRGVVPATQAILAAAGEAQLVLLGHGLASEGAWIKDRILDAAGRPMEGGTVQFQAITPGNPGQPDLVMARLQAGTLPPGHYFLELRAGSETRARAVALRPFEVMAKAMP
jgi:VWFA-related protein